MNCVNCGAPMELLETRPCWQCRHCGTMICIEATPGVQRRTFAETVIGRRRAAATPAKTPVPTSRRELERRIACPACGARMITDWYYGPGNIVIDTCPACDLVWLDAGELQRAVDAPGSDRRH